jgi:putrescine importer
LSTKTLSNATIVIAMVAMMLTASSYGRMAAIYPAAGSAYTYVRRGLNPHLGFLVGWAMFLDYLIIRVINIIYVALTFQRVAPEIPYFVWVAAATAAITRMNLRSIRFTARESMEAGCNVFRDPGIHCVGRATALRRIGLGRRVALTPFYGPQTIPRRGYCHRHVSGRAYVRRF